MNAFQRILGSGPRGALVSVLLLWVTGRLVIQAGAMPVHGRPALGHAALLAGVVLTAALVLWSLHCLPTTQRGNRLVTNGPFQWVRHPLYAAFLLFFDFGLALWLDHWFYVVWAAALYPVWHLNIRGEERLMRTEFGGEYEAYCADTGRFLPRWNKRPSAK